MFCLLIRILISLHKNAGQVDDRSSDGGSKSVRGNEKREVGAESFEAWTGRRRRAITDETFCRLGLDPNHFTAEAASRGSAIQAPFSLSSASRYPWIFAKEDPSTTQPEASLNDRQSVVRSKFWKNPMHRSGIALAGAPTTVEAWKRRGAGGGKRWTF